ncbi:MAG: MogA/MoaB family molybdenum cofactor biosynthesis protein [Phycisphaerae bacterium]|jgi:molybdenum cofactor synthesis domain-containing protein
MTHRAVVITVSDRCSRGEAADHSGPQIIERLADLDAQLVHRECIPDDAETIRRTAQTWIGRCDVLLLTGGTGIAPRDVTPDALRPLIERELPGFGEVMRQRAFERTPTSVLSRAGAGVCGQTLLVWMPGSPRAVSECVEWLTPAIRHACRQLAGDAAH